MTETVSPLIPIHYTCIHTVSSAAPIMDEYVFDIEPMEKEWMLALIDSNMDEIHRILMVDNTFINKKGFLHGWVRITCTVYM